LTVNNVAAERCNIVFVSEVGREIYQVLPDLFIPEKNSYQSPGATVEEVKESL